MNEQELRNEINQLRDNFTAEINSLKEQLANLQNGQQNNTPTSVQEQLSHQIMSRSSHPDQTTTQYSGR